MDESVPSIVCHPPRSPLYTPSGWDTQEGKQRKLASPYKIGCIFVPEIIKIPGTQTDVSTGY